MACTVEEYYSAHITDKKNLFQEATLTEYGLDPHPLIWEKVHVLGYEDVIQNLNAR